MRGSIKTLILLFIFTALAQTVIIAQPAAAVDSPAFLHIPGIKGSVDDPAHRNWIEVLSCDWGSVPPPRGSMVSASGTGPAGKLCFGDFSFLKLVDESSRILADYCSRGVQLSQIRVELPDSGKGSFKFLVLRKVKILSVRPGKASSDGSPTEIVTVGFRQVEYQ